MTSLHHAQRNYSRRYGVHSKNSVPFLDGLRTVDCSSFVCLDDIFIFAKDFDTHLERLEAVFSELANAKLKLKPSKCKFFMTEVNYLGYKISKASLQPDPDKVKYIASMPQ